MTLGVLKEITDLRTIWPHEALDFTPWLSKEENMALLSNTLGIDIIVDDTESDVGDFHLDILASESGTGRKIIIENQLEDTNHDHLGKIITYASGKDANFVIWLVKHARDEHKAAVEWLNNHTDDTVGFFLCEIKLYKIGDSDPAVKFEVVEKPNDWAKQEKRSAQSSKTEQLRYEYWQAYTEFIAADKAFLKLFKVAKPSNNHWLDHYVGRSAFHLTINMINKRNELTAEIYIGDDKDFYRQLFSHKDEIETKADMELDWRELPERKASRILVTRSVKNFDNRDEWPEHFAWIKDTLKRIYLAVKPFV